MKIDVYSDNICPWCYIGKKHLDQAIAELGREDIEVRWHPYQLYPQIPPDGVDRKEFMRARFGDNEGKDGKGGGAFKRIEHIGEKAGIKFDFKARERIPNTLNSHRLLEYGAEQGVQHEMVEVMMSAGFEQGRDLGDINVLAEIAVEVGLDADATLAMLKSPAYREEVHEGLQWCLNAGITGVPFFRLEDGEVIQGAQPMEIFRMLLAEN
jgi:predicted DsbA family dithiol-disulfide isomerase